MTFRRIMLVVLPVLGVVFVFTVLWYLYLDWEASLTADRPLPSPPTADWPAGVEPLPVGDAGAHLASTNVNLSRRDQTGRLEMQFLADRVTHKTKHSVDIEQPRIQFFTKRDEVITLLADQGTAVTKGSLMSASDIESGRLWGDVVLVHDRGTPDDLGDDILVTLDDLAFDNTNYTMATDGPVVLTGGDMSLTAEKMQLELDPDTRRIKTMTFSRNIFVTLDVGDRMGLRLMGAAGPAAQAPPAAEVPAPTAAPGGPDAEADAGEIWHIVLKENVDARQGTQRLQCRELSLYNRTRGAQSTAAPKPAPGDRPTNEVTPAKAAATAVPMPLVVVAEGPLKIVPVTPEKRQRLGDSQYQFTATGTPVTVDDGDVRVVGAEVRYNTRTGVGSVIGKDGPIRLEQPDRLLLTGDRLDFNRNRTPPTVEVTGEGRLEAQVQAASLTGTGPPASAAETPTPEPLSRLEASWTRGMSLEFHRLPSSDQEGMGEIKRATFHGNAVVKQVDGVLKGERLEIAFAPAQDGRGQSVERLVGEGDVFVKNAQPPKPQAPDATKPAGPRMTVGDIACQKLDMRFERDPAGATQPKSLEAHGAVAINDPQGRIRAEHLMVRFGKSDTGATEVSFLEASGNVLIDRDDLHAEGMHVLRDLAAGTLVLEGTPAKARQGESRVVGRHIEFSEQEGRARVTGPGELEIPATTDLRGRPRATPEPLLVTWQNGMLFEDKRNFANFDGKVTAITGGSELACERLWLYFADRPAVPVPAAPAPTVGAATATEATPAIQGSPMQDFFGRKSLVRVLAEENIRAAEQRLADDKTLQHRMEILGDNLTYLEENRKAYIRGPGRVRILARESVKADQTPPPGLDPKMIDAYWTGGLPLGYARTDVAWTHSMAFDGTTNRAYFQGSVDATHGGRGIPGTGQRRQRRMPTNARITGRELQVVFSQKAPGATPAPAPTPDTPPEDRMAVEKLVANGNVLLWIDDRRGSAERLLYQREPELIRLYRGPDQWARLWQENEATQEFDQIVARTITYDPDTGRVDVVDQQMITISPKPKATPQPLPRLVPAPRVKQSPKATR